MQSYPLAREADGGESSSEGSYDSEQSEESYEDDEVSEEADALAAGIPIDEVSGVGVSSQDYYDPVATLQREGRGRGVPHWALFSSSPQLFCCWMFGGDAQHDLGRLYRTSSVCEGGGEQDETDNDHGGVRPELRRDTADSAQSLLYGGSPSKESDVLLGGSADLNTATSSSWCCGGTEVLDDEVPSLMFTNQELFRMRRAARVCLLVVSVVLSMAQWSALGSGVEVLTVVVELSDANAAAMTSAMFAFCFIMSLVGGVLGDYRWGSRKVLTVGLVGSLVTSLAVAAVLCPALDIWKDLPFRVLFVLFLFLFAGSVGFCQTAIPALIGDQCVNESKVLDFHYGCYYATIQLGSFVSRLVFPLVHVYSDWFASILLFMCLPSLLGLIILLTHRNVLAYKIPAGGSAPHSGLSDLVDPAEEKRPAVCMPLVSTAVVLKRYVLCRDEAQLHREYGWATVEDALSAAGVLKLHLPLPVFWALYFQMFELWYLQTKELDLNVGGGILISPEQSTMLNPLFDVILLLVFSGVFRAVQAFSSNTITPYSKIFCGYLAATLSFVYALGLQYFIESRDRETVSVWCQLPQFIFMAAGEVLLYPAALHLVYVSTPISMRSFVQSCLWFFIGLGNLGDTIVLMVSGSVRKGHSPDDDTSPLGRSLTTLFIAYSCAMFVASLAFMVLAALYTTKKRDKSRERAARAAAHKFLVSRQQKKQQQRGSHGVDSTGKGGYDPIVVTNQVSSLDDGFGDRAPLYRRPVSPSRNQDASTSSTAASINDDRSGSASLLGTPSSRPPMSRSPGRGVSSSGGVTYYSTRRQSRQNH